MKKVLIVAHIDQHIRHFHLPTIQMLNNKGWQIDVAANGNEQFDLVTNKFNIPFDRFPLTLNNVKSYIQLKKIIRENDYDIVHAHTPVGGAIGRFANRSRQKKDKKTFYTVHGFHFAKGGPKKDWALFYPLEKYLSKYTDVLFTINSEDTEIANTFHAKKVFELPGIGIDWEKFQKFHTQEDIVNKRKLLGIPEEAICMISIGELSKRKNHIVSIRALAQQNDPNLFLILCGMGPEKEHLFEEAKALGIQNQIKFIGYTKDVLEYLAVSDFSLYISRREGLGIAGLEAMASGLPLISSNVRGIRDYTHNLETGVVINNVDDYVEVSDAIAYLKTLDKEELSLIKQNNREITKQYKISKVLCELEKFYDE